MAVERARIHFVPKPWGRADLRPWNSYHDTRTRIGEVWFERPNPIAAPPALLLKLIFTDESHSNPMDLNVAIARGCSQNGSDAWYILSAGAESRIAVGSKRLLSGEQLRGRILEGALLGSVQWQTARATDSTSVYPDMFQAIGSGLVIVEIHATSDSTPRVAAPIGPSGRGKVPRKLTAARTLLFRNGAFVLERITLAPGVVRELDVSEETWLFVLAGAGGVDSMDIEPGTALFVQSDRACIEVGAHGLQCLVAYARSAPVPCLLRRQSAMRVPDSGRGPERTSLRLESPPILRSVALEGHP
ncbi:MAG: class I mannose-6-phosphate isomerase [Steroidobacteraceae bacterium]